ncbi:hypothetical protein ASG14_05580 [Pedobacter sp. Leaf194]|nr:hypothetical protein ASG14_05580 [Pedobacter sp. Leaf194]
MTFGNLNSSINSEKNSSVLALARLETTPFNHVEKICNIYLKFTWNNLTLPTELEPLETALIH